MRVGIDFGREHLDVDVREGHLVGLRRQPPAPALSDPAAAVRAALDEPQGFPALRRALTPDDHVGVVVSDPLSRSEELLSPVLQYVLGTRVASESITVLCSSADCRPAWLDSPPAEFRGVRVEVHDPQERRHLSYLATTKRGRRIYLNRTAVDADQLVVLSRRRFDPVLGYSGSEAAVYPALTDAATQQETLGRLSMAVPEDHAWPVRQEATEVAWLLGAPFMVQVIEGEGDQIAHVLGGLSDTSAEGEQLLNARWRVAAEHPADTVVASVGGDPARHDFADLARAMACAARVVRPQGRIIILSQAVPHLAQGAQMLRQADNPEVALDLLRKESPPDTAAAYQWANAVQQASVYLLSRLPPDAAEELFTSPLEHAGQVQRLLDASGSYLFLPDAHKTLAVAG